MFFGKKHIFYKKHLQNIYFQKTFLCYHIVQYFAIVITINRLTPIHKRLNLYYKAGTSL